MEPRKDKLGIPWPHPLLSWLYFHLQDEVHRAPLQLIAPGRYLR